MVKGLAMGINKGHVLKKIKVSSNTKEKRPRKRISVIRKIVHEIIGHAPYKRKVMGILK
jgi:hypothetical protein